MKHVIVGNGPAGVNAATTLRRIAPADEVAVVAEDAQAFYSKVLTSYFIGGKVPYENMLLANAEQLAMMDRGQIDAAWSPEPWGARLIVEAGGKLLAEEKDLWPGGEFTLALVITTPGFLAEHPDVIKAVLRVHRSWTKRLATELQRYGPKLGEALNKLTGKALPPAALEQALQRTKFTDEPLEDTIKAFATWAYELGLSRDPPELTGLVDTTILRSLAD